MNIYLKNLTIIIGIALISYAKAGYSNEDIWAELKRGGNVILIRHALAEQKGNPLALKLGDCSVQRNLSEKGRKQAEILGKKFQARSIRINSVLSSRYCRTQETAKLVFNRVTLWQQLDLLHALPDGDKEERTNTVLDRIVSYKGKDNLVMVTHKPNIQALTFESIESGEFLVLKPDQSGDYEEVGKYVPDD